MRLPLPPLPRGLRQRLMVALALYALALVTLYTLYALAFAYTVEDEFIERAMHEELSWLRAAHAREGVWPAPRDPHWQLLASTQAFPIELQHAFAAEPHRREFSGGEGRHYHLLDFEHAGTRWWLLAEVSEQLVFRRMRATVLEILGWSALGALTLGLLLAWWVARATTRPLSDLSEAVRALDPQALPRRLPETDASAGDAEVLALRHGLNELLARVADTLAREQSFTRDASHELRTPLAVIVASAEELGRQDAAGRSPGAALARLQTAADQLGQTLDALLELARAEPAHVAQGTALLPAIERAIVEQSARRPREDLDFEILISPEQRSALRPALLRIVLANLIGNVCAHAAPGPVRIDSAAGRCRIRNCARAGLSQSEHGPGLGQGLSILRRLDERYGLQLRIEAQADWVEASFVPGRAEPARD